MSLTRKELLRLAAVTVGATAVGSGTIGGSIAGAANDELRPIDAFRATIAAIERYPLVGLGDAHLTEDFHTFLRTLIQRPEVKDRINDIVVECGNALYQDIADRFLLDLRSVEYSELSKMWRNTLGGRTYWDAPIYEQLYRTVRKINECLPRSRRIRVVLGDISIDWPAIRSVADAGKLPPEDLREPFYAEVVEREVLAKGRRAILHTGGGHLHRRCHTSPGGDQSLSPPRNPNQPTAGTILSRKYPGKLYLILPFSAINSFVGSMPPGIPERAVRTMTPWPAPSVAALAGTWLGTQPMPLRALTPNLTYAEQVDALLWLGPDEGLTCSRPDPAIYQSGAYADELQRRSEVLRAITGNDIDLVQEGIHLAGLGPSCLSR